MESQRRVFTKGQPECALRHPIFLYTLPELSVVPLTAVEILEED